MILKLLLHFIILFVYFFTYVALEYFSFSNSNGIIYKLSPFIIFYLIYSNYRLNIKLFDVINIFNFSVLLFSFLAPFFSLFIEIDINTFDSIVYRVFSNMVLDKGSCLIVISVLVINITYILSKRININSSNTNSEFIKFSYFFGKILFIFSIPLTITALFIQIFYVINNGFLSLYNGELQSIVYPLKIIGFAHYFFYYGFFLIASSIPPKKKLMKYAIIFIIISLFEGIKGSRIAFIFPVIYLLWYLSFFYKSYNIKNKLKYIFVSLFIVIFLTTLRENVDDTKSSIRIVPEIIASQSRSVQLIALYEEYSDEVEKYGDKMITSNLLLPYYFLIYPSKVFKSQNYELVKISNNFKNIITFVISPEYYFAGGGLGGTYIVELKELGLFFLICISILIGILFSKFTKHLTHNHLIKFLSYSILLHVFIMIRGETFPNMWNLLKLIFFYYSLKFLIYPLKKNYVKYIINKKSNK